MEEYNHITPVGWTMLFGGLVLYWLKKLDEVRYFYTDEPLRTVLVMFLKDYVIEIVSSFISCLLLGLLAPHVSPELIDMRGYLTLLLIGMGGGTMLNGIINKIKRNY